MKWHVYLSGEIHSAWRQQILNGAQERCLPIQFYSPVEDHQLSDNCGTDILGNEEKPFWKDHKSARLNSIRIDNMIKKSDIVVVKFGDQYKQWNAAFEAGKAIAWNKTLITLHHPDLTHALKEINAAAMATAASPSQVIEVLNHVVVTPG